MLEYNFYKSKQKEKIMKMPEEFKTLVVKSEPLYFKENFEGKEINSELIFEKFKSQIIDLIEVQIKFMVFHNVLVSIYENDKQNEYLNMCIECSNIICDILSKALAPVYETCTKM